MTNPQVCEVRHGYTGVFGASLCDEVGGMRRWTSAKFAALTFKGWGAGTRRCVGGREVAGMGMGIAAG